MNILATKSAPKLIKSSVESQEFASPPPPRSNKTKYPKLYGFYSELRRTRDLV